MATTNVTYVDALERNLNELLQQFPDMKEEALREAGQAMLATLRTRLSGTPMADAGAKVSGWQKYYLGSRLGYVAVRPVGGKDGAATGPNGPGAITNYNESGHKIRGPKPSGKASYRYRPRIKKVHVDGYHFYYASDGAAQRAGIEALNKLARRIAEEVVEGVT